MTQRPPRNQAFPAGLTIRPWQESDDVAQITQLLHAAYRELAARGMRFLASHQTPAMTRERLTSGFPIVAVLGGEIVGTATLYGPNADSPCPLYRRPGVYCFGQFGVSPALQRQGIGRQLVQHLEATARERGATTLALDTAETATHLIRWYESLGFREIDRVRWDVTNYESIVMAKSL